MKLVQSFLCDRKDLESNFHHCAGPISLFKCRKGVTLPFSPPR